jgi:uncharacterized membrane protein
MATLLLGQSGSISSMLIWIIILIVIVFVGALVIFNLRRRMLLNDENTNMGSSGLLDHLYQMHKSGQIDDEEFAKARNAIIHQVQEDMDARMRAETKPTDSLLDDIDSLDTDS